MKLALLALTLLSVVGCSAAPGVEEDTQETRQAIYNGRGWVCFEDDGSFTPAEVTTLRKALDVWNALIYNAGAGRPNAFSYVPGNAVACHDVNKTILVFDRPVPGNPTQDIAYVVNDVPNGGTAQSKIYINKDAIADHCAADTGMPFIGCTKWYLAEMLGRALGLGSIANNNDPNTVNVMPGYNSTQPINSSTPFCLSLSDRKLFCQKYSCNALTTAYTCPL